MTWDEFKKTIDDKLAEKGLDGNIDIWFIDIMAMGKSIDQSDLEVGVEVIYGLFVETENRKINGIRNLYDNRPRRRQAT